MEKVGFKLGDFITGTSRCKGYGVTNEEMLKAEVIAVSFHAKDRICIRVLEHCNPKYIGSEHWVYGRYFDFLCRPACNLGALDLGKFVLNKDNVEIEVKNGFTFITIDKIYTICIPTEGDTIGLAVKDPKDQYDGEIAKGLALYRTFEKIGEFNKKSKARRF